MMGGVKRRYGGGYVEGGVLLMDIYKIHIYTYIQVYYNSDNHNHILIWVYVDVMYI